MFATDLQELPHNLLLRNLQVNKQSKSHINHEKISKITITKNTKKSVRYTQALLSEIATPLIKIVAT